MLLGSFSNKHIKLGRCDSYTIEWPNNPQMWGSGDIIWGLSTSDPRRWSLLFVEQTENETGYPFPILSDLQSFVRIRRSNSGFPPTDRPPCTVQCCAHPLPTTHPLTTTHNRPPCSSNLRRNGPFSRLGSHTGLIKPTVSLFLLLG